VNTVRCETSGAFRNKKREYLKGKINELRTNNKDGDIRDLYRGINEFKNGYQSRTSFVKYENGNLLAESHGVLNRWKNYFCQLFIAHGVNDVGQTERHTAEPLVSDPFSLEDEIAIVKLKSSVTTYW
jgi:hypothetical protein